MLSRETNAGYGTGGPNVWNEGPAEKAMCCATQDEGQPRSWCTAEELECADPSMQDLKIYILWAPYSDTTRTPDEGKYCYVATKNDRIVAFWHRFWS